MRLAHSAFGMILGAVALAGCSQSGDGPRPLHDLRSNSGSPEEFAIVPNKPLVIPESMQALPTPTPGGANRTDPTPKADAVAALGGNPAALVPGEGVAASDAALVQQATRYGTDPAIRQKLATEDAALRQRKGRFNWSLVPRDNYGNAYRRETLDPYAWLRRYRAAGARTPSAPPAE